MDIRMNTHKCKSPIHVDNTIVYSLKYVSFSATLSADALLDRGGPLREIIV